MKLNRIILPWLTLAFIACVIVGTLTHELGHYAIARQTGNTVRLHFNSSSWQSAQKTDTLIALRIRAHKSGEDRQRHLQFVNELRRSSMAIVAGGPVVTLFIGTLGFLILLWRRKHTQQQKLNLLDWLGVFLSLFWLRQVFNMLGYFNQLFINGPLGNDEVKLAGMLGLQNWSIVVVSGIIGILICGWVIFVWLPRNIRFTFLLSAALGCGIGYWLWFCTLGPAVLP